MNNLRDKNSEKKILWTVKKMVEPHLRDPTIAEKLERLYQSAILDASRYIATQEVGLVSYVQTTAHYTLDPANTDAVGVIGRIEGVVGCR